ncbi:MARVEL domain-containing protein sing [Rhodnius prolixus]|uniref:MARVEL domain-containing protein sing n=1 Tax=Rhodnius prolixus TaxID=13249 RepID=UPI003D18930D
MGTRIITHRAPPVIQTVTRNGNNSGCTCCCSCLHLSFLKTPPGLFKIAEVVLGSMCQSMMMNFGTGQSQIIGMSFTSLLTTNSASVFTVSLLLLCYILSETSYSLIRSSLFETLFNFSVAFSYCSASTYLAISVNLYLYPLYLVTLGFIAYPAMIAAYMMGFALGVIHAVDAYYCYRHYKGYR